MKNTTVKPVNAEKILRLFKDACINKAKTSIRVEVLRSQKGRYTNIEWDYFELDKEGVVVKCPRGWAKEFKGKQLINLDCLPPMRNQFTGEEI